jgi:hypothetical protein
MVPMSGWRAPAPHTTSLFCRPLGLPNRLSGPRIGLGKKKTETLLVLFVGNFDLETI